MSKPTCDYIQYQLQHSVGSEVRRIHAWEGWIKQTRLTCNGNASPRLPIAWPRTAADTKYYQSFPKRFHNYLVPGSTDTIDVTVVAWISILLLEHNLAFCFSWILLCDTINDTG